MQLNTGEIFLNGIDASSITAGLDPGEFNIKDASGIKWSFFANQITSANMLKRFAGVAGVRKVTFSELPLPTDCCEDTRASGITTRIVRDTNPTFSHETYLDSFNTKSFIFPYEEYEGVVVSAADVATEIARQINYKDAYFPGNPFSAVVDPADPNSILITDGHPDFPIHVWNIQGYAKNVITVVTPSKYSTLDDFDVKRRFPLLIGNIPGADTDVSWQGGKNPAYINLIGGTTQTNENLPYSIAQNAVHNYGNVVGRFQVRLWVDCDEAGYADFLAALEAAIPAVTIVDNTPT